ncbi:MAG: hypothetical protein Q4F30_06140 [Akkermansia sp.]|nr:hypothetical protein [Akkermansia sp.]
MRKLHTPEPPRRIEALADLFSTMISRMRADPAAPDLARPERAGNTEPTHASAVFAPARKRRARATR